MDSRYLFYIIIVVVVGFTTIVSSCTYQSGACRREAIKAGVNVEHIRSACSMG